MGTNYHIFKQGTWVGPFSTDDIKKMIRTNGITVEDYVCQEGAQDTVQIKSVPDLMTSPHVIPPPPQTNNRELESRFTVAFILCLVLGIFGGHRFYLGRKKAVLQLLTLGGLGVWTFIDLITLLLGKFQDGHGVTLPNHSPKVTWAVFVILCLFSLGSHGGKNGLSTYESGAYGEYWYHSNDLASLIKIKNGEIFESSVDMHSGEKFGRTGKIEKSSEDTDTITYRTSGQMSYDVVYNKKTKELTVNGMMYSKDKDKLQGNSSDSKQRPSPSKYDVAGLYQGSDRSGGQATIELYSTGKFVFKSQMLPNDQGNSLFGDWALHDSQIDFFVSGSNVFVATSVDGREMSITDNGNIFGVSSSWKKVR